MVLKVKICDVKVKLSYKQKKMFNCLYSSFVSHDKITRNSEQKQLNVIYKNKIKRSAEGDLNETLFKM